MEIKNTSGLASDVAAKREFAEIKTAENAKSFKLRLENDGQIDRGAFKRMLTAARVSKAYKNNFDKYQFTIKSDRNGQYLSLKQQGLWSRFKGLFGIGSTARQEQRAQARNVIESALKFSERVYLTGQNPEGAGPLDTRLTKAQAMEFQSRMMNESGISPVQTYKLDRLGVSAEDQRRSERSSERNELSGPVTFSGLIGDEQSFIQEQAEARRSAEPVPDEDPPHAQVPLPGRPQPQVVNWLRENSIGLAADHQSLVGDQPNSNEPAADRRSLVSDQPNSIESAADRQSRVSDQRSVHESYEMTDADAMLLHGYLFAHVIRSSASEED